MPVHFTAEEMAARKRRLLAAMAERRLDGLLLFAQESDYWLTGYDSFGFCFFQCLYVGGDGRVALLTRSADLRQAQHTSNIADVRIWKDGEGADPTRDLRAMLADLGARGRLGVEFDSYGLTHFNGLRLQATLAGFAELVDASTLIPSLRTTKSGEELVYVREAARLSDLADRAALEATTAGADEGEILAAMHAAIFAAGGDYPGNEFIIGSGADALLCRYKSGRRKLSADDQLTLEFAGVSRHYHAAVMRTHVVGRPKPQHVAYHAAAREALLPAQDELRPGRAPARSSPRTPRVRRSWPREPPAQRLRLFARRQGCAAWMDLPMFYERNAFVIEAGQVYFLA